MNLAVNVNNWITQVLAGEAATDPNVFILFLGATVWTSAYVGTFALSRSLRPLGRRSCSWASASSSTCRWRSRISSPISSSSRSSALVLLVRLHIVALQERWNRNNIVPSGEMDWRLLRGGLTWTMVLVIMSLVTPRVGAAEVLNRAYSVFETPYHAVEAEWQRFFAGVSGPSRLRGVSFTEAIRLGQSPNLADRVVMTVDAPQGRFWNAISYDFYTGNGWRTTETRQGREVNAPVLGREKFDATFEMQVPQQNLLFAASEPVRATVAHQFQTGSDRSYSIALRSVRSGADKYTVDVVHLRRGQGRAPTRLEHLPRLHQTEVPAAAVDPAAARARPRAQGRRRTGRPVRQGRGHRGIPAHDVPVRADRPCTSAGPRPGGLLPLRPEGRLLRVLRLRDGRDAARARRARARGRGLHHRNARPDDAASSW